MFLKREKKEEFNYDSSEWINIDRLFSHRHVLFAASEADTYIYLEGIKVKHSFRNKGYGTTVLKRLIYYANRTNKVILLEATDSMGSDLNRLIKFYERFGFISGKMEYIRKRHNMFYIPASSIYYPLVYPPQTQKENKYQNKILHLLSKIFK